MAGRSFSNFQGKGLGGRPVGRPRTSAPEPSGFTAALIAAKRYSRKQQARSLSTEGTSASNAAGLIQSVRGAERREENQRLASGAQPLWRQR